MVTSTGAASLRVDAIASKAGLNKRMIYHYFGNRAGLLDAANRHLWATVAMALVGAEERVQATLRALAPTDLRAVRAETITVDSSAAAWTVLSALRQSLGGRAVSPPELLPDDLSELILALVRIALPVVRMAATMQAAQDPGGAENVGSSRKPRVRMTPVTRVRGDAAAGD